MASRVCPCLGCTGHTGKCPTLTTKGRCSACARAVDQARGTTTEQGRGWQHQLERKRWARRIAQGPVPCARCDLPITRADDWHLDHNADRTGYLGPSHARCNTAAGGRAAHGH